jgi:hypothetical protein
MRIAFDLDGVLADLQSPFLRTAARLFPDFDLTAIGRVDADTAPEEQRPEGSPEPPPNISLTPRQAGVVWRYLVGVDNLWESLDEIERGATSRLATLADERRWDVVFVTSRPVSAGRTVQRQSQRWLERAGFPAPSVLVVQSSRGRIAAALDLDILVDDRPEHCLDAVLESKAGAILVWRGDPASVPGFARRLGIAVVPTVAACLDALIEADGSGPRTGFLERLRKIVGLSADSSPLRRD